MRISTLIKYSSFLGVKNVRNVSKIMEIKVAKINVTLTVLIRLNAAAFIKLLALPMRRLFKSSDYFEISFFAITDNSYCKSFVNIM